MHGTDGNQVTHHATPPWRPPRYPVRNSSVIWTDSFTTDVQASAQQVSYARHLIAALGQQTPYRHTVPRGGPNAAIAWVLNSLGESILTPYRDRKEHFPTLNAPPRIPSTQL